MPMTKMIFLISRAVRNSKLIFIFNLIIGFVISVMLIVSIAMIDFFRSFSSLSEKFNQNLRTVIISTDREISAKKVLDVFSQYDFVELLVRQNEYSFSVDLVSESGNYGCNLKSYSEKNCPEAVDGDVIDFNRSDEVLLPKRFVLYNNKTGKNEKINSEFLIGKKITFLKNNIDDSVYFDESNNKMVYGSTHTGETVIELMVTGIYDNKKYFQDEWNCIISDKTAKVLCASDKKDSSGFSYQPMIVVADSIAHSKDVARIAKENGMDYTAMIDGGTHVFQIFIIIGCVAVFLICLVAVLVFGISVKIDTHKNINNYSVMYACGYSMDQITALFSGKQSIYQFISLVLAVPMSCYILHRINEFFHATEDMGGQNVEITLMSIFFTIVISALTVWYSSCKIHLCISQNKAEIKNDKV